MAQYTGKKTESLNTWTSIEDMPLYNFDRYRATQDNNWFLRDFTGSQKKINSDLLKPIEEKINNEYYAATDDRTFQIMIQNFAKIDKLRTKYVIVSGHIEVLSSLLKLSSMNDKRVEEIRARNIQQINDWGFKMSIMATPYEEAVALNDIHTKIQGIKTQIRIIENEMKVQGTKATISLEKQILFVSRGLQLGYKINSRETTVFEWIEMCNLLQEIAKKN